jgi:hypothetical protein
MRDEPKFNGSYLAVLLAAVLLLLACTDHFRRTGKVLFQPDPPFRATADGRPGSAAYESLMHDLRVHGPLSVEPVMPGSRIMVLGYRDARGRLVPRHWTGPNVFAPTGPGGTRDTRPEP